MRKYASAGGGAAMALAVVVGVVVAVDDDAASVVQGAHQRNLERLREALGAQDWRIDNARKGEPARLALQPGSAPARRLPNSVVTAGIQVTPAAGPVGTCPPPSNPYITCELVQRSVRITRSVSSQGMITAYAKTLAEFVLPGRKVAVEISAYSPSTPDDTVHAGVKRFDDAVVAAATDDRAEVDSLEIPDVSAPKPRSAKDVNSEAFVEHLGGDWIVMYNNGDNSDAAGILLPHRSPTARSAPKRWEAEAAFLARGPKVLKDPCRNIVTDIVYEPCQTRTLPDGRTVQVRRSHGFEPDFGAEGLLVSYTLPDGTRVVGTMTLQGGDALRKQARAWVDAYEDELVAAVTDARVRREADPR